MDVLSGDRRGPGDSAQSSGTGEVPKGLERVYLQNAGFVRIPYVVNRASKNRQGKATELVAFAKPSADGGAVPAVLSKKGTRIRRDGDAAGGCNGTVGRWGSASGGQRICGQAHTCI